MKRDANPHRHLDLLRNILLTIEERPDVPPKTMRIETFLDLCDEPLTISLHLQFLHDAGLIEAIITSRTDYANGIEVQGLTFAGYEYLATIRNDKIWAKVKERVMSKLPTTLNAIKAVAIEEVKRELGFVR